MFWDKKDKGLPDLPQPKLGLPPSASEDDEDDEGTVEKHGLPSFPDSPIQKGFSQTAIKDAITQDDVEKEDDDIPGPTPSDKSFKTVEIDEWSPEKPKASPSISAPPTAVMKKEVIPAPSFSQVSSPLSQKQSKGSEVFIKIDKFYSAKKALEAASSKLEEIDELLKKIRDTKLREEQELSSWEKEVATIKSRIKDVTDSVFEKI